MGVMGTRREMLATRSGDNQCTLAYVNAVGANDGLIFDGGGFVFQNGRPVLEAPRWRESWASAVVDLDRTKRLRTENTTWRNDCIDARASAVRPVEVRCPGACADLAGLAYPAPAHGSFFLPSPTPTRSAREEFCEDLLDALALGIGDYFEKTRAFKGIGIAREINTPRQSELLRSESCDLSPALIAGVKGILQGGIGLHARGESVQASCGF